MDAVQDEAAGKRARGLDRAFEILDFLRQKRQALKPNEIAAQIGAPRSSVYELVNLLLSNGILEFTGGEGRVYLGRKLYFLGAAYENHFDFTRECEATLERLADETRETAQFCMQQELARIWRDEDVTTILVTHDLEEAIYLADRILILPREKGAEPRLIDIDLPRPRDRSAPEFVRHREQLLNLFGLH